MGFFEDDCRKYGVQFVGRISTKDGGWSWPLSGAVVGLLYHPEKNFDDPISKPEAEPERITVYTGCGGTFTGYTSRETMSVDKFVQIYPPGSEILIILRETCKGTEDKAKDGEGSGGGKAEGGKAKGRIVALYIVG